MLFRSSFIFPLPPLLSAATGRRPSDLEACQAISWWGLAFVAVALPLRLLRRTERRQAEGRGRRPGQQVGPSLGEDLLRIYMYSFTIWRAAVQLGPLVWRMLPPPR